MVSKLITDLQSEDINTALKAVEEFKHHGNNKAIKPIIDVWVNNADNELGSAIEKLLGSLKDTECLDTIINEAINMPDGDMKAALLATLWSAGMDCSDYLQALVDMALNSGFMVALECLTIIENMEGPFDEAQLMESLINLRLQAHVESKNQPMYVAMMNFLEKAETVQ